MRDLAIFYKAMSDEIRLKMMWLLMHHKELCVCDFMEVLDIKQSKASRHLRNLYHAGLVTDRRDGLWAYYSLTGGQPHHSSHLRILKKHLATQPDAIELLENLQNWLARKQRKLPCR
jgi:ArsR family transcriptional regulator